MKKLLLGAGAIVSLIAATPASAQVYTVPSGDGYYTFTYHPGYRAQAQVPARTRTPTATSPYILGGRPYRGTDPDAFIRDYMRTDPLGSQDN